MMNSSMKKDRDNPAPDWRRFAAFILVLSWVMCLPAEGFSAQSISGFADATNAIRNITLAADQEQIEIKPWNNCAAPYLWIIAHGNDKRGIEHGTCLLKIEVNGVVIQSDRSVLQDNTYAFPVHYKETTRDAKQNKYDPDRQAWAFKYDVDFIMNNQTRSAENCGIYTNYGIYTTRGYNHWYAFNVTNLVKKGENTIRLNQVAAMMADKNVYGGIYLGEICLCSLEEIKIKIAEYEKRQLKIDPAVLAWDKVLASRLTKYNLSPIPGSPQRITVKDGYLQKDDKPFFMLYGHTWNELVGRENILDIYSYYSLVNTIMAGPGGAADYRHEILSLPIYLKEGWEKYRVRPEEMAQTLGNVQVAYQRGVLALPQHMDHEGYPFIEQYCPEALARDRGENLARIVSKEGKTFPDFAHPGFKEYLRQAFNLLGRTFQMNPGFFGYSVWEEYGWRVAQSSGTMIPQGTNDLVLYHDYLEGKYKTIAGLNDAWGTQARNFAEINFPVWLEQTGNFADYQQWRAREALDCARIKYEALKNADTNHIVLGHKTYGDLAGWPPSGAILAVDNWQLTKYTDVSREYSSDDAMAHLGRSACREFGRAMMDNSQLDAMSAYGTWSGAPLWTALRDQKDSNIYPFCMGILFNGSKSFYWEERDIIGPGSINCFLFYNKYWRKTGACSRRGLSVRFENRETADVIVPAATLNLARLHQWGIRNAALILPAEITPPQIAVLLTTSSRMIGYDPQDKFKDTPRLSRSWVRNDGWDYYMLGDLFRHLHLQFDCVEEHTIDNIFNYKVLIVGYQANVANQRIADKISDFVRRGGTVLFYPEAASMRDNDFQYTAESPGFGLSALCGASINNKKLLERRGLKMASGRFAPEIEKGAEIMDGKYYGVELNPKPGTPVMAVDADGAPVLVSDKTGRCCYLGAYLGLAYYQSYPRHEQFARLIEKIIMGAGVEKPVGLELGETADRRLVVPGLMTGRGYWLAAVHNFSGADQTLVMRVGTLPDGSYELVDISGERPVIEQGAAGDCHLQANFVEAQPSYVAKAISNVQLKKDGVRLSVPKYYSKVLLIRPAGVEVWANSTVAALKSYVELKKPLKIVVGDGCNSEEKKCVEKLRKMLADNGLEVAIVKDNEIKTRVMEGNLVEDGCELEKYRHEVIDDPDNLILIGHERSNAVIRNLQTAGHYTYCKVPEMVNAEYPGAGRGLVQIVECVNAIAYDASDRARDAILLTGSDAAGVVKAVNKFCKIISLPAE